MPKKVQVPELGKEPHPPCRSVSDFDATNNPPGIGITSATGANHHPGLGGRTNSSGINGFSGARSPRMYHDGETGRTAVPAWSTTKEDFQEYVEGAVRGHA
jgi:hypothetical protein